MIRLVDAGLAPAVVWLLTYLGHSTLWVGGAWLLGRLWPALSARARSLMWRMALVGPLFTCALQLSAGSAWTVGSVRLSQPPPVEPLLFEIAAPAIEMTETVPPPSPGPSIPWTTMLLGLAAAVAVTRVALLLRETLRLRQQLGERRPVTDRRLRRVFARLRAGLPRPLAARLTESGQLTSPVALGVDEVCLPVRARELDDVALAAVLGHELAHLERRDNVWLMVGAAIEALFFFQPLNRLARHGLQESAELASDERAVELTDDPLGMARSLAEVAAWGFGPDAGLLASRVVSGRGALLRRVRSLLERDGRRQPRWVGGFLVAGLAALALALPSFGEAGAQAALPEVAPVVAIAPATAPASLVPPAPVRVVAKPARPARPRRMARVDPARVVPPPVRPSPVAPAPDMTPRRAAWPAPPAPAAPPAPPALPAPPAPPAPRRFRFVDAGERRMERDHGTAFVLVKDGNATAASASADEQREALALKSEVKGEYLWVRRHDKKVVITDPEAIASLRPMLDEQRGLRTREAELSVAMAELGKRQAELGKQQAEMGTKHAELGMKSAQIGVRRAELDMRRMEMKLKARQGHGPMALEDGKNDAAYERELAELSRMEGELKAQQQELGKMQHELGQKHGELGRQQGELGRQQGELGRQQGELGRRMGDIARDRARLGMRFGGELDRVVEQQVGAGKARVLPDKGR